MTCAAKAERPLSMGRATVTGKVGRNGFTFIELMLVLVLIALLVSIVAPVVSRSIDRAKESTLKEDLYVLRKSIDDYYADNGGYPLSLELLVEKRYIRHIPVDPITDSKTTWQLQRADASGGADQGGIADIHSGSELRASDGSFYKDW